MSAFAIILAAGRGSRMKGLTAEQPKCLLELAGKPLLYWQTNALKAAGITDIHIVKGYRPECIPDRFGSSLNELWASTNMLYSLACASEYITKMFASGFTQLIVSYSDIVYHPDHVRRLLNTKADIAITYDVKWLDLWKLRFDNILEDAETFREQDGFLREIGGKASSIDEIHGQYMGLLKMSARGWLLWNDACGKIELKKMDMTGFLKHLLASGQPIAATAVEGRWCEADSAADLSRYEQALSGGSWSHDWRGENDETW